ncbi:MAG: superoxide dismutase [Acidobacteria bacterium]|nr:superoxide dismutase [Acidobacteriota bacterium]
MERNIRNPQRRRFIRDGGVAAAGLAGAALGVAAEAQTPGAAPALYQPQNFDRLLGVAGFSDQLLKNHFTLYQGYVTQTNRYVTALAEMVAAGKTGPEYAEMKRRFGWEFNGMRLHEYYFDGMIRGGKALAPESSLAKKMEADFGGASAWEKDFKATGAMRGIGWVILCYDSWAKRLFNIWTNEHDVGHLAGVEPLLIMDVFEHAFMIDYGLRKADYIEAYFKAIDWTTIVTRFAAAEKAG